MGLTHPRILEGLQHLADMRDVMPPGGVVDESFLGKLERFAANPEIALQQLSAAPDFPEPENVSMTGMIAEQAALYGATPGPGEPDTRELWFVSPEDPLKEGQSATEIAPRLFRSLAEAIELITETVTPDVPPPTGNCAPTNTQKPFSNPAPDRSPTRPQSCCANASSPSSTSSPPNTKPIRGSDRTSCPASSRRFTTTPPSPATSRTRCRPMPTRSEN